MRNPTIPATSDNTGNTAYRDAARSVAPALDFEAHTFADLVDWLGESRERAIFRLMADYVLQYGDTGGWRCSAHLHWAVHVMSCALEDNAERRWAANLLARLGITADAARGIRCREEH